MPRVEQWQDTVARLWGKREAKQQMAMPVTLCVTSACQLRCTYCYEQHKGNSMMTKETAKKFIDMIVDGTKGMDEYVSPETTPGISLEFIGGEPFMNTEVVSFATDYWFDKCIREMNPWAERTMISICSNGVAYRDSEVQKYLQRWKDRMSFSVTLDGTKEMHDACRVFAGTDIGSYDLAYDAATDWMNRGGYMGSKITVSPGNITHTYEALRHMIDIGYTEILANCVYEKGWTVDHAKELYKQLKKTADYMLSLDVKVPDGLYISMFEDHHFHPKDPKDLQNWCGGNGVMIACDWNGDIYPCIRYMDMSLGGEQPPMILGNVNDGLFSKKCERDCYECLKKVDRRTQSTDECFNCPIAEGCSWCTAYNYQVFGTPDKRATYICPMHKARALANAWFWPRYYEKYGINRPYYFYVPDNWALEIIDEKELDSIKEKCYVPAAGERFEG